MGFNNIICPVSSAKIDSSISRISIFINVVLMGLFLYTFSPYFMIVVAIDYFIRAFGKIKYSPTCALTKVLVKAFNIKSKPIDLAPKKFAARLGFLCAATTVVLYYLDAPTGSIVVATMLMALSTLDSVFNFCVGCLIYHSVVFPFFKNKL